MQSNTEFITSVKINGSIPDDQDQFSDAIILNQADEALQQTLLPVIMETSEEYFVFEQEMTVTANKRKYRIPTRSIGGISVNSVYLNISATTTYYLKVRADYTVATPNVRGRITAVRIA